MDEPVKENPSVVTQVRIPADVYDFIVTRAEVQDISRNATIVRMLRYAKAHSGTKVKITKTEEWTV